MITLNAPAPEIALGGISDGRVRRHQLSDYRVVS
jgi:hypothetical protein